MTADDWVKLFFSTLRSVALVLMIAFMTCVVAVLLFIFITIFFAMAI